MSDPALEHAKKNLEDNILKMKIKGALADENGYVSPEKYLEAARIFTNQGKDITSDLSQFEIIQIEHDKLFVKNIKLTEEKRQLIQKYNALVKQNNENLTKLKEEQDNKSASWGYIKAGVIIILMGTIIGLIDNPNMFSSASKKILHTVKYIKNIRASKNNINILGRSLSFTYKRIAKFVNDNQLFSMCFGAGVFLIGIGIWKRYW